MIKIPADAQMVTYSGPVEYHLEMIKTAGGGGTDGGFNRNVNVNEKQIVDVNLYVIFTGAARKGLYHSTHSQTSIDGNLIYGISGLMLTDIQEKIHFNNTVNNEGNDQKISQACYDDRMVFRHNAEPGDSRTERLAVQWIRKEPDEPVIEGGKIMFRDNNYTLTFMGEMKVNVASEKKETHHF